MRAVRNYRYAAWAFLALLWPCPSQAGEAAEWTSLFDGRTLDGWKEAPYTRRGPVSVKDGMLVLGKGRTTGIALTREFPATGYEIRFEAARLEGKDFFAASPSR